MKIKENVKNYKRKLRTESSRRRSKRSPINVKFNGIMASIISYISFCCFCPLFAVIFFSHLFFYFHSLWVTNILRDPLSCSLMPHLNYATDIDCCCCLPLLLQLLPMIMMTSEFDNDVNVAAVAVDADVDVAATATECLIVKIDCFTSFMR